MKVSVSLPVEDVEFLDSYVANLGLPSRSAAMHKAVCLLKSLDLGSAYESAWDEWQTSGESRAWEPTAGDGLTN